MKNLPIILVLSRIPLALVILALAIWQPDGAKTIISVLMLLGLLTDVFDGMLARKMNVSSERLRTLDSNVDQVFWIAVIASVVILRYSLMKGLIVPIGIVLGLEIAAYVTSYLKFKRTIATHSLLAKLWTLSLLVFLIEILLFESTTTFYTCFWLGVISRLEIIGIILKLKKWANDIPSIWVVSKINKGAPIKKSKWFNS